MAMVSRKRNDLTNLSALTRRYVSLSLSRDGFIYCTNGCVSAWCEPWEIVGRTFTTSEDKRKDLRVRRSIADMKDKIAGDHMTWYATAGSGGVGSFLNVIFM